MDSRGVLVAVSAAQLAAGIAGQLVALRERRSFDIALLGWRGQPERVARDSWLLGTGLSAPVAMFSIQAAATLRLGAGPSHAATRILGWLGATMACGYLIEREFRSAVSPAGWNPTTTPVAAAGFTLALAMAASGLRGEPASPAGRRAGRTGHRQSAAAPTLAGRLRELAELHKDGILSDDEFAAAKAKLLGGL